MVKAFIAKPATYFDAGTEADLIQRYDRECGLFLGFKNGKFDEEVCRYDEFDVMWLPEQGMRNAEGDDYESEPERY